jgi:hypothetical protein
MRPKTISKLSHDLYLRRNDAGDEGRALLALSLHRQGIMPREGTIAKELDAPIKDARLIPSIELGTRAEAVICALAFDIIGPKLQAPEKQRIHRMQC